jgi:hypothetical protein
MDPEMAGDGNMFAKLNDGNYANWKMMMEALLVQKQLWEIVSGGKTRPLEECHLCTCEGFSSKAS